MSVNIERERVARYIVVREDSNRIIAKTAGTHDLLNRIIDRLEARQPGVLFFYDDATEASKYLPMDGPGVAVSGLMWGRS